MPVKTAVTFGASDGKSIFYSKARGVAGLWKVSISGDGVEEAAVPELSEAGYWRYWAVTEKGIYFVVRAPNPPYAVKFYDYANVQIRTAATVDKTLV